MTEQVSGFGKIRRGLGKELQAITLAADGLLDIISGIIHIPGDIVNKVNTTIDQPTVVEDNLEEAVNNILQEFEGIMKNNEEKSAI